MNQYCNGPLKLNTNYYLSIGAFTAKEYQETWPVEFRTEGEFYICTGTVNSVHFYSGHFIIIMYLVKNKTQW